MKITRDTPDQLIIENNPVLLAILLGLFALGFVGIGLFSLGDDTSLGLGFILGGMVFGGVFLAAFIRRSQVIFDRSTGRVEMRRKSVTGYRRRDWDLADLDRAIVERGPSDGSMTYRTALVFTGGMDAGTHPITIVYSSGGGADRAAKAINRWLDAARLDSAAPSA
jgi:hypothetical protein|tara:strand:+ start:4655 stop:5152 length:498 start_codon:yes stop_codon:yes gene_type:complete